MGREWFGESWGLTVQTNFIRAYDAADLTRGTCSMLSSVRGLEAEPFSRRLS